MSKVHIGHSTVLGATCGMGSPKGDNDITVSARSFFIEIASKDRCSYCSRIHYPYGGGGPERTPETLDQDD